MQNIANFWAGHLPRFHLFELPCEIELLCCIQVAATAVREYW